MTKSSKDLGKDADRVAAHVRDYAINKGTEVAVEFLKIVSKQISDAVIAHDVQNVVNPKELDDELSIMYSAMVHNHIITLLMAVQRTQQIIAATGFLSREGIPWHTENMGPDELMAETARILREEFDDEPPGDV